MRRIVFTCLALGACGDAGGAPTTADLSTSTSAGETASSSATTVDPSAEPTTAEPTTGTSSTGAPGTSSSTGEPLTSTGVDTETDTGTELLIVIQDLHEPESMLYDAADDVYLIANIHGAPDAVDDNGYIARIEPDGDAANFDFISGADPEVTLDAPKGMAIVGDVLYVADITWVRKFDRVSGAPLGGVEVPGAMFLNDLSADPAGDVYVSDMLGQSIHRIDPQDQLSLVLEDPALAGPNGLVADATGVTVATYTGGALVRVDFAAPAVTQLALLPSAGLDGLARLPDGAWFVSSWEGTAIYRVSADFQAVEVALGPFSSPADIDIDPVRGRVLVPLMTENAAEVHMY